MDRLQARADDSVQRTTARTSQIEPGEHCDSAQTEEQNNGEEYTAIAGPSFPSLDTVPMAFDLEKPLELIASLAIMAETLLKEINRGTNEKIRLEIRDIRVARVRGDDVVASKSYNLTIEDDDSKTENEASDEEEKCDVKDKREPGDLPLSSDGPCASEQSPLQPGVAEQSWPSQSISTEQESVSFVNGSGIIERASQISTSSSVCILPPAFAQAAVPFTSLPTHYDPRPVLLPVRKATQGSADDTPTYNEDRCQSSLSESTIGDGSCNCGACILTDLKLLSIN